jgi:hypothetical protein
MSVAVSLLSIMHLLCRQRQLSAPAYSKQSPPIGLLTKIFIYCFAFRAGFLFFDLIALIISRN